MPDNTDNRVQLTIRVDADLLEWVKQEASLRHRSMSQQAGYMLECAILEGIEDEGEELEEVITIADPLPITTIDGTVTGYVDAATSKITAADLDDVSPKGRVLDLNPSLDDWRRT